jgi:8-oxo-dGTP pyrophosphatase MutT (NUDIX family)
MTKTVSFTEENIRAAGVWSCDQVKCCYTSEWRDRDIVDTTYVNECWKSYRARYPFAFNGGMLGLVEIKNCDASELLLLIRHTCYAEYVATRDPFFHADHPQSTRANPIGITIVALSSDDNVVITRRAGAADQNPGLPYFVGGYAEPPASNELDGILCANAQRELAEELGISNISTMLVIGIAMDPLYCHPELFVVARLHIQASDVHSAWSRAQSRDEASGLILLPVSELLSVPSEILFPSGVTWSFEAGAFLLKQWWDRLVPVLRK